MLDINNILIELDIIAKIEETDKIRIRNDKIEIDTDCYSRYGLRKMYGDSFERSIQYLNSLIEKTNSICTTLITIEKCNKNEKMPEWMIKRNINEFVKDFVDEEMIKTYYKHDPHFKSYLKNITEKLSSSINGLINLCKSYHHDKNKVSKIENIISIIKIQIEENNNVWKHQS
jgi:hypothetical protein